MKLKQYKPLFYPGYYRRKDLPDTKDVHFRLRNDLFMSFLDCFMYYLNEIKNGDMEVPFEVDKKYRAILQRQDVIDYLVGYLQQEYGIYYYENEEGTFIFLHDEDAVFFKMRWQK